MIVMSTLVALLLGIEQYNPLLNSVSPNNGSTLNCCLLVHNIYIKDTRLEFQLIQDCWTDHI